MQPHEHQHQQQQQRIIFSAALCIQLDLNAVDLNMEGEQ